MAGFDLEFNPENTEASPLALRADGSSFKMLRRRILGQSHELGATYGRGAAAFTDGIGWQISGLGETELENWKDAGASAEYCALVSNKWADHVEDFKTERTEQISEWNEFKSSKAALLPDKYSDSVITADSPSSNFLGIGDASKARSLYAEVLDKLGELEERANKNWTDLRDHGDDCGDMLREGPTPENVRLLMEGGYTDWFFYNIDPGKYSPPIDLSPEMADDWATQLEEYWSGERPMDDNYEALMLIMGMLATRARLAQEGIDELDPSEMEILEIFFDSLENSPELPNGVTQIPSNIPDSFSEEERERVLGILGDNLLALSDPDLGGGYDSLPESVRRAVEGIPYPTTDPIPTAEDNIRFEDVQGLVELFSYTDENMKGGYGFSTQLSLTTGVFLSEWGASGEGEWLSSEDAAALIDVATRNEDANHFLLTGELLNPEIGVEYEVLDGPHWDIFGNKISENGDYPDPRIEALAGILTTDWHDDGAVASQLTDWISRDSLSDDPDVKSRADWALAGLIESMAHPDLQPRLENTSSSVDDTRDLPGGEEEDFEWKNVSMGHLNPEIANSFADIFDAYVDEFAATGAVSGEAGRDGSFVTGYSDRTGLQIGLDDRSLFARMVAGNPDASAQMFATTQEYVDQRINDFFTDPNEADHEAAPRSAGLLLNSVMNGISNEAIGRAENHNAGLESEKSAYAYAVDIVGGAIPNGYASDTFKTLANSFVDMKIANGLESTNGLDFNESETASIVNARVRDTVFDLISQDESWDGQELPDGMLSNGEFSSDPNSWELDENVTNKSDGINEMREKTWTDIRGGSLDAIPDDVNLEGQRRIFMEQLNIALGI